MASETPQGGVLIGAAAGGAPTQRRHSRRSAQHSVAQPDIRGDLLLLLLLQQLLLIDVTVTRPTLLTELKHGTAATGPHLVAARHTEARKLHVSLLHACVPAWAYYPTRWSHTAAKANAAALLQRIAAHSLMRFSGVPHACRQRVLSTALQIGNACVAGQGTAELHLQAAHVAAGTLMSKWSDAFPATPMPSVCPEVLFAQSQCLNPHLPPYCWRGRLSESNTA